MNPIHLKYEIHRIFLSQLPVRRWTARVAWVIVFGRGAGGSAGLETVLHRGSPVMIPSGLDPEPEGAYSPEPNSNGHG